jgi:exopolyphosphatase/guanosine-5'-triphosphate,3'-diphosphate pyrophosphatase
MQSLAVIDLGSNTFHLLIVGIKATGKFDIIFRQRVFVGLSDGGVRNIKQEKIEFGLEVLKEFKTHINHYGHPTLKVIGTAILRNASNRQVFIDRATHILGKEIEIIDGIREADLIFKGITLTDTFSTGTHLIMDIGGGSTEFVVISNGIKIWSNSYLIGVGVLHEMFHKSEPISAADLTKLKLYVLDQIYDMLEVLKIYRPETLAGASGSFEVLQTMTGLKIAEDNVSVISAEDFLHIYDLIVNSDLASRKNLEGMPKERAKLIVVGMALKKIIFDMIQPTSIVVSPYALKEGVISEMINKF